MNFATLASAFTVVSLLCFLAIVFWAYSRAARKGFDEAAMLPFHEDEQDEGSVVPDSRTRGF